jgi:hypothetical protein
MAAKWMRKDGSLLRPPEPETYMILLTRDQSQRSKPSPKPKVSRRTNSLSARSPNLSEADPSPTP